MYPRSAHACNGTERELVGTYLAANGFPRVAYILFLCIYLIRRSAPNELLLRGTAAYLLGTRLSLL